MNTQIFILILACIMMAFFLKIDWLITALVIILFIMALASIKSEKPRMVAVPKPGSEDILHPVIYEDVGEPPLLYPEFQKIKINQNWWGGTNMWQDALGGVGNAFKSGINLVTGNTRKKDD